MNTPTDQTGVTSGLPPIIPSTTGAGITSPAPPRLVVFRYARISPTIGQWPNKRGPVVIEVISEEG